MGSTIIGKLQRATKRSGATDRSQREAPYLTFHLHLAGGAFHFLASKEEVMERKANK
jgi:hypothetical protein